MERSYYTVVTEGKNGELIAFNTLLGSLALLDVEAAEELVAGEGSCVQQLADAGFMLEHADDEIDLQRVHFQKDIHATDTFGMVLAPGYACNFACPYCYQQGLHKTGKMTQEMLERIMKLVEAYYERDHFENFYLGWYGGEPLLYLDVIEAFSQMILPFCDERGISTRMDLISNTSLATPEVARRLAECRVDFAMCTFEGMRDMQNARRLSRNGEDTFESVLQGMENFRDAGIKAMVMANLDKNNASDLDDLQELFAEKGFEFNYDMLKDYYNDYALGGHTCPGIDLFTEDEYAKFSHDRFLKEVPQQAQTFAGMFTPVRNYCRRYLENYLVIDGEGDVYKCDGWMGHEDWKLFSVFDDVDVNNLRTSTYDPHDDPECATCRVLPLCRGYCRWEREAMGFCSMFKRNTEDYVRDYRACFGDTGLAPGEQVKVLVAPRDIEAFYAVPMNSRGIMA